ncbi:MAG: hypothetical protein KDK74_01260 [Cephaloticoccus sp.]|nr:hypothetical protein [Cephaloticoccus sp.]
MRILPLLFSLVYCGCGVDKSEWQTEYMQVLERWERAYQGPDAELAYAETLAYAEYLEKMQTEEVTFRADEVLVFVYPRLGLLAEHLGREEDAKRHFDQATLHARLVHPSDPETKSTEEAFRGYLEEMDTPDKTLWRRQPNQPPQTTATSGRF